MYDHCKLEAQTLLRKKLDDNEFDKLQGEITRRANLKPSGNRGNDIIKAGQEIAQEQLDAKKIAKRNAALNMKKRVEIYDYVKRVYPDRPDLGVQAILVGTNRARMGSRNSVAAAQNAKVNYYTQGFLADVESTGHWKEFVSGQYDDEIAEALWSIGKGQDVSRFSQIARDIAPIVDKWNEYARIEANRAGAWIGKQDGYIVRQSHDMHKIRNANRRINGVPAFDEAKNFEAWKNHIMPLLDIEKTFKDLGDDINEEQFLKSVWEALSSGVHMIHNSDGGNSVPSGFASLAKRMSHDRIIHFKDGKSWAEYNRVFGNGSLREAMLFGLERSANSTALMEGLGPNPQMTLDNIYQDIAQGIVRNQGSDARAKFGSSKNKFDRWMAEIDGSVNIPANKMAAQFGAITRAIQSMSKLGGAVITSITDLPQIAGEMKYQGKGFLYGYKVALDGLMSGKTSAEKNKILGFLGVSMRGLAGASVHKFSAQDDLGGTMSSLMRTYFKYNGMTWWTDNLRKGVAFGFAKNLADNVGNSFGKLNSDLRRVFSLFGIDEGMWEMMRRVDLDKADDELFFTPEMAKSISDADAANYLGAKGIEATPARVSELKREIENKFRSYFIDRVEYAVIEPDARVRTISKLGTRPGTPEGEITRFIMQFKSFPTAILLKPLARDIYGRGLEADGFIDTLSKLLRSGNGEKAALAHMIVATTAFGYLAMAAKDTLKGRTPRDPSDPKTWLAAAQQGGGLGIYGDFLFGDMKNRFGGGAISTLAGPTAGTAESIVDLIQRVRDGDDVAASALNTLISNTPYANLFYTRAILDYLIIYRMKEAMNPGYLKRMERRMKKENGQEFIIKPSETVK